LNHVIVTNPKNSSTSPEGILPGRGRRSHGRTTLADVARHAGVTTMTVSRTLRDASSVAPQTADKVRASVQAVGYRPNKQAGLLASGRSQIVAALIPSIAHSIFAETIQGLSDTLQGHGLELMLAPTGYSLEREEQQLRAVLGWAPAAVVVTGRRHTPAALALLEDARSGGTPVIEIWDHPRGAGNGGFVQIGFDHREVGQMMARHLLARGYRSMAYVDSGVPEDFRAHERGQGFLETALAAGAHAHIFQSDRLEPMLAGRMALSKLQQTGLPQALAFANDQLAAGAVLQAQALGLRLPTQLAVLGFGDFPIAAHLAGGISSVAVPRKQIGHGAGLQVLESLGVPGLACTRPPVLELQPRLVLRSTT
jgi:LacI family gluconate utilization system Gnt-I transcriptional repressor